MLVYFEASTKLFGFVINKRKKRMFPDAQRMIYFDWVILPYEETVGDVEVVGSIDPLTRRIHYSERNPHLLSK